MEDKDYLSKTFDELMSMTFCVVPWCERPMGFDDHLYCEFHRNEQSKFEADMLSIDEPEEK